MKTEERPYTATSSATIPAGYRSAKEVVLVPQFREMHGYCDGQCFYGPATCATNPEKLLPDCEVAASVAQHSIDTKGDLYCDTFGKNLEIHIPSPFETILTVPFFKKRFC